MPRVGKKHYPYTKAGKAMARKAKAQMEKAHKDKKKKK